MTADAPRRHLQALRQLGEALDRAERAEAAIERARDALDSVGVLHPVAADHVLRALDGPQDARSADSGTGAPPEPENGAQGRIGWLRPYPEYDDRLLTREVPGGWIDTDEDADPLWLAENYPHAEFTPIRALADDEVAVKRGVLDNAAARLRGVVTVMDPSDVAIAHEAADALTQAKIVSDALEAGR